MMKILIYFLIIVATVNLTKGADNHDDDDDTSMVLSDKWEYCFEFTWLGPDYNNYTIYNGTCQEYLDEKRAKDVPCSPPIVITDNGQPPNMTWLWENKLNSILCLQSANKVCARYTYKFNGRAQNITYMCTKAQKVGYGAATSGCYTQTVDGYEMEVCLCKSQKGLSTYPCNNAQGYETVTLFLLSCLFSLSLVIM